MSDQGGFTSGGSEHLQPLMTAAAKAVMTIH